MKHAYLIAAHNQIELLKKIIFSLDSKYNDLYIHLDSKCKYDINNLKNLTKYSNVYFIERRSVSWGGYSQIQLEIDLLKSAYINNYDYYHLISGVDFPIKSNKYIYAFFKKNKGYEFVRFDKSINTDEIDYRIGYYHFLQENCANKKNIFYFLDSTLIFFQKKFHIKRDTTNYSKGSNWFSITNKLANYILSQENVIKKRFRFTRCADEIFLQSIIINSPFYSKVYNNNSCEANLREVDFKRGNPYVFDTQDIDLLLNSSNLFARKFDYISKPTIVNMLIEELQKDE